MFDSESTYNSVKNISTLKSLSFNGTALDVSADVTDSAETNKTVYKIYVGSKTSNVKLAANFYSKKAAVSANIIENEDAYIYVAYYNENGKVIKVNRYRMYI